MPGQGQNAPTVTADPSQLSPTCTENPGKKVSQIPQNRLKIIKIARINDPFCLQLDLNSFYDKSLKQNRHRPQAGLENFEAKNN